ncbi:hypothetical protein C0992_001154 [Termitomyces sp. T32_za158]|nr:hypothetical protein C0992_001154 [Termitomyces sp. T32_za158]
MSSSSASTSFVTPAILAAQAYVPKLDMFLASLTNVGPGADQKTVVGTMKEHELWECCMACYVENAGAAWLAPFEANFAPAPPSIDEQLASLLGDDGPFMVSNPPAPKVAAYVEPLVQMDLARQECQQAEAAAQSAAIMLAEQEVELLEEQRVALAELLAKHMADAQAAGFLEAVGAVTGSEAVGMGEAATGGPAVPTVEVVTAEPADEAEATEDDDDADNEDEVTVMPKRVPTAGGSGRSPVVIKRASKSTTPSKHRTQKVVPQYELPTATTFTDAQLRNLLVPRVKGKKTISLSRSGIASQKVAKAVPRREQTPPVAGPSWQIISVDPVEPVLCPGGVVLSDLESPGEAEVQSDHDEAAESSDLLGSLSEVPAVPQHMVQPNYMPLPIPRVDGQEFLWLGKALDYPISALCPSKYIEAAKEKAAAIAEVMQKDMWAAAVEMEELQLRKKIMERSVDILERYQANCTEALEWREANKTHLQQPFATLFLLPPGAFLDP